MCLGICEWIDAMECSCINFSPSLRGLAGMAGEFEHPRDQRLRSGFSSVSLLQGGTQLEPHVAVHDADPPLHVRAVRSRAQVLTSLTARRLLLP